MKRNIGDNKVLAILAKISRTQMKVGLQYRQPAYISNDFIS